MDPLRTGAIFKIKDVSKIRSPAHFNRTGANSASIKKESPSLNSLFPVTAEASRTRELFDLIYRATPVPKSLSSDDCISFHQSSHSRFSVQDPFHSESISRQPGIDHVNDSCTEINRNDPNMESNLPSSLHRTMIFAENQSQHNLVSISRSPYSSRNYRSPDRSPSRATHTSPPPTSRTFSVTGGTFRSPETETEPEWGLDEDDVEEQSP